MSDSDEDSSDELSIDELERRLKQIEKGLRRNLSNLHKQLSVIESKPELLSRLTIFKKDKEMQACDLEAEVKKLQEDITTMKEFLGMNLKKQNIRNS
ncbi:MAG: hypothetical protein ACM3JE_01815 [Betaproteobacteria bacterium]|jgi:hypothetical protein